MNRRDFLRRMTLVGIGAALFPFCPDAAEASWYVPPVLPGVTIKPTYLSFGPLENRFVTDCIVVHHIGNTNADVSAETVHEWHLHNGWSGIGYHFLIRKDGTIEEGRPMGTVGAHVYGENRHTIGINIVGDFESAVPTEAQKHSAAHLIAALCIVYQLNPIWGVTVKGHRDFNATACPGRYLYAEMPDIVAESCIYYGSKELQAERLHIMHREREEQEQQQALLRERLEAAQKKNGRPSHPTPSTPNPPVRPTPERPSLRPNKRPDIPKPGNTTQRRIATK
ncbi:peptidoglycan recognition protein family protein [Selenomonas flueggei]|uniref:Tat pathway signal sequence domain protein n=1 Tax=Selenomonas flueggei ATCC 43531 TaxID=638302 RepID=C4V2A1_9FIRM|nr:peptidoglycan recognition family protein [Selenomonas flueggei]EEQ48915.1 Tat pathway signal sequence domain protein [Selenomonas flueggei ATCC 43531]